MLTRAGCGLVLTEPASTTDLGPGSRRRCPRFRRCSSKRRTRRTIQTAISACDVAADQLAYIYFTSGSTGEPKGAMCEHVGMVNHLFAKIDDLGIGEGQVVAQTAPQCFDISLWQLVSALLVGGRTLIVEQDVILDVRPVRRHDRRWPGQCDAGGAVLPRGRACLIWNSTLGELSDLRCVSVTGEAIKKELTQRWFASQPQIKLVNAYGLTETSDDTNHEVMEGVPASDRVPLGRAINNVQIQIVDEYLAPVPLGAPGEIVFSGDLCGPRIH